MRALRTPSAFPASREVVLPDVRRQGRPPGLAEQARALLPGTAHTQGVQSLACVIPYERDAGDVIAISWPLFKALCHQCFGTALGTNHLSDQACLPFCGTVVEYQEAFQAWMVHTRPLSLVQQVQLFIGGLPNPICNDVELQGPTDL